MQARTRADDATVRAKTRRLSGTPEPQGGKPVAEAPRTPLLKGPQGRGEPKRKVPTPPETPPGRGPSLPAASPSRRRPRSRDQRARGGGGAGRRGDEAAHPAQDPPLNAGARRGRRRGLSARPAGRVCAGALRFRSWGAAAPGAARPGARLVPAPRRGGPAAEPDARPPRLAGPAFRLRRPALEFRGVSGS